MAKRRVVVTGLGMLTPLGNDVSSTWQALLQGQSGIALFDHFDPEAYTTKFAGLVKNFDVEQFFPAKEAKKWIYLSSTEWLPVCRLLKSPTAHREAETAKAHRG